MTGKILSPPEIIPYEGPTIFLAGPIQGAPNWQNEAIQYIQNLNSKINIANPRREYLDGTFVYGAQVDWETHHLNKANINGAILFWLAKEEEHFCERAYAQTTRFELAEWKVKQEMTGSKLVVGIEEGFSNAKYIQRRFSQDCPEVAITSTLEDTCKEAVRLVNHK
jgi:hypothetical protein